MEQAPKRTLIDVRRATSYEKRARRLLREADRLDMERSIAARPTDGVIEDTGGFRKAAGASRSGIKEREAACE